MLSELDARRIYYFKALDELDKSQQVMTGVGRPSEGDGNEVARLSQHMTAVETKLSARLKLSFVPYYKGRTVAFTGWLLVLCFLLGLGSNYLGSSRTVNILLNPLMALFAWNLLVYLLLPLGSLVGKTSRDTRFARLSPLFAQFAARLSNIGGAHGPTQRDLLVRARMVFLKQWVVDFRNLTSARLASLFHLCACTLVVGVIAGLYLRGLTEAYTFEWRSTFIQDEQTVMSILNVLFAPISLLAKLWFPSGPPALSEGAAWIHFLALASFGYVLLPRCLLSVWQRRRAAAALKDLSIDTDQVYFRKLLSVGGGSHTLVLPYCYSYSRENERYKALLSLLRQIWGSRLKEGEMQLVDWGSIAPQKPLPEFGRLVVLLLLNGAQTPEDEVHGSFTEALVKQLEERDGPDSILALVDGTRVDSESRKRRRAAWAGVLAAAGVGCVWLDADLDEAILLENMSDAVRRLD